jgi:small subunit ribosomal protein S1
VSDNVIDEKDSEEESFADLLESYGAGMNEDVQLGDKIKGEIISIGKDTVFIDTGTKIDGVVDKKELLDDNRELPYNCHTKKAISSNFMSYQMMEMKSACPEPYQA